MIQLGLNARFCKKLLLKENLEELVNCSNLFMNEHGLHFTNNLKNIGVSQATINILEDQLNANSFLKYNWYFENIINYLPKNDLSTIIQGLSISQMKEIFLKIVKEIFDLSNAGTHGIISPFMRTLEEIQHALVNHSNNNNLNLISSKILDHVHRIIKIRQPSMYDNQQLDHIREKLGEEIGKFSALC